MSSVNCSVTPAYVWVFDSEGKCQITLERLNLAATPVVTVNLADVVDSADIKASAVTAAKLADAVADQLITAVATVGADAGTTISVAIQVKDSQGNNLAQNVVLDVWLHDAAGAYTPSATATASSAIDGTKGYVLLAIANGVCGKYVTDSTGLLTIVFTQTGALTRYISVGVQGKVVAGSGALIFTA
jgi:protocatechuate 3,4-dioxygenase beta subunit